MEVGFGWQYGDRPLWAVFERCDPTVGRVFALAQSPRSEAGYSSVVLIQRVVVPHRRTVNDCAS